MCIRDRPAGVATCTPGLQNGSEVYKPARAYHAAESEGREGEEPGGCVALISSGSSSHESAFLDASESGDDVFILTTAQLGGADTDKSYDVYDAHVCSGEA